MSTWSEKGGADALQRDRACPGGLGAGGAGRLQRTSSKAIAKAIERSLEAPWDVNGRLLLSEDCALTSPCCGKMEGIRGFNVCKSV